MHVGTGAGYSTLYYFENFSIYAFLNNRNISSLYAGSSAFKKRPKNEEVAALCQEESRAPLTSEITFIDQE